MIQDCKYIESLSESEIINLAINHEEIENYSHLNDLYFSQSVLAETNIQLGVVETPDAIIEYMLNLSLEFGKTSAVSKSWYDPCSGSGKFTIKILERAIRDKGRGVSINDLPEIAFSEISKFGFYITLVNISRFLNEQNMSLKNLLASGKLKPMLGDALEINPEIKSLLYNREIKADIIIGNPPFVRSSRLTKDYKAKLADLYPSTYCGNEDLYSYFYTNAYYSLNENGQVCFISPASFFKKSTSDSLRAFLYGKLFPQIIVDLDENNIFENVSLHTVICLLGSQKSHQDVGYHHAKTNESVVSLLNGNTQVNFKTVPISNFTKSGWLLESHGIDESKSVRLKDTGLTVRSGVRPGNQAAFIYKLGELNHLPQALVRGAIPAKSIIKWVTKSHSKQLLFMTQETKEFHEQAKSLLTPHQSQLTKRSEVTGSDRWMQLRPCSYYELMNQPKIIFADIASTSKFSLDESCSIILDGAFFINSADKCLLGILNSSLAWRYFKASCSSIGNAANRGRLRLKKSHVENFPLPKKYLTQSISRINIERVVTEILTSGENDELLGELDNLVSDMYK